MGSIRPQMVAILLIALSLQRLLQRPTNWELWYLFGLTVVLANAHVSWVFVPFLWILYPGMGSNQLPVSKRWMGFCFLGLSGFLTPYSFIPVGDSPPYFFINYALLWDYLSMPSRLKAVICEFRGTFKRADLSPV